MILTTYKYIRKRNTNFPVLFQKLESSISFILFNIVYFSFNYFSLTKTKKTIVKAYIEPEYFCFEKINV